MPLNATFLPYDHLMKPREILTLVRVFSSLGVKKVRLTGGEPLARRDFPKIWELLTGTDLTLNLTTNGVLLKRYLPLLSGRLHYLNVSLDSLKAHRYARITRSDERTFYTVLSAVEEALDMDFAMVKVNVVVIRGFNDDELLDFVALTERWPVAVRFIEFMPFNGNGWSPERFVSVAEMRERIGAEYDPVPVEGLSEVSRDYKVPGFKGVIGFIGSISEPFCNTCNRLRLTADGHLKPCLFHPYEVDLLTPLREGVGLERIAETIRRVVAGKPKGHPGAEELLKTNARNRSMFAIGG